jgi:MscS family membrane protein
MMAIAVAALARATPFAGFALGTRVGFAFLILGESLAGLVASTLSVLVTLAVGYAAFCLVDVVDRGLSRAAVQSGDRLNEMVLPIVRTSLRVTIVMLVLLQIAQSLTDKPLTSILAGLGVGGLAIALAAQDTVKNFFGSLVIFADKPFLVGERVVVDSFDGVVEQVGFRSTRLRTLDGHLVTIPNGELANKAIQNIGRRPFVRRVMTVALPYDTPVAKVDRALEILRELLREHHGMRPELPPRVTLQDLGPSSMTIQILYWFHPPDYWDFMAFSEQFNRQVVSRFQSEGIAFALPAQRVHVVGPPGSGSAS